MHIQQSLRIDVSFLEDRYRGGHIGEYKGSFQLCKKKKKKGYRTFFTYRRVLRSVDNERRIWEPERSLYVHITNNISKKMYQAHNIWDPVHQKEDVSKPFV